MRSLIESTFWTNIQFYLFCCVYTFEGYFSLFTTNTLNLFIVIAESLRKILSACDSKSSVTLKPFPKPIAFDQFMDQLVLQQSQGKKHHSCSFSSYVRKSGRVVMSAEVNYFKITSCSSMLKQSQGYVFFLFFYNFSMFCLAF